MKIIDFKRNILKISLIFIMLISAFLCFYTVGHYKGNNTLIGNNQFKGERNKFPNGENLRQNRAPLDENTQSGSSTNTVTQNGNMTPPGKNIQSSGNIGQGQNKNMSRPNGNMQNGSTSTATKYVPLFTTYSIAFLILFVAGYYFFIYKKIKLNCENEKILIFILLVVGLLLRISSATLMEGFSSDINLFKNWAMTAANNLSQVYSNSRGSDYPPLYIYVLAVIGKIQSISMVSPYFTLMLKLPSIVTDIVTSYIIYKLATKYLSLEISILVSAFYIFNPATFIDSAIWGQVDSFFTFLIVLAVFLLSEKKVGFSAAMFSAAVLMKPQGIIFLPVLFFELVRKRNLKTFIKVAASALITAVLIILPFSFNQDPLWIFKLYSNTISEYPYASVNAFNFFSLLGANYKNNIDNLFIFNYHTWGIIFIVVITLFSWFIYIKGKSTSFAFAAALIQIGGVFIFSVGMHERYLFPAAALAILTFIYLRDKRLLIVSMGFSATIYMNIYSVLFGMLKGINSISFSPILIVTSFLNVLLFIYLVKVLFDIVIRKEICTL